MANKIPLLLLFCTTLSAVQAYSGPDLPKGPFCGGDKGTCCKDRQDHCSHRILDTVCYCDEFCNRSRVSDDCCPDYEPVCLNLTAPEKFFLKTCKYKNKEYVPTKIRTENCNKCTCTNTNSTSTEDSYWECETDICLISDDVVYRVNGQRTSWRAYNYTEFYGKKLKDALIYKLGTLPLSYETLRMGAIRYDKDISYPLNFDARNRWKRYISPIVDQGWCGSDWAVSIAGVASDRFAIQSNGAENMVLSPQSLLSCSRRQQKGCDGGHIDVAWNFARNYGLVDEDCFPYKASAKVGCPFRRTSTLLEDGCRPPVKQRTSRYRVGPPGRLKHEKDIMYDIMESGPVQAIMTVYQDFFHYRDGIYRHTEHGDIKLKGLHSVRIVGWGEEYGDKYWIVANSWGTEWGENGYFRIARGYDESGIESFVVTVLSEVTEAYQRK